MAGFTERVDDPVERMVELAMQAQMRLMLAYMDAMKENLRAELQRATRNEFGGEQPYFGKGTQARNDERDAAVRADKAAGLSLRAIAKKHHMSKTQVSRVLVKEGTDHTDDADCATSAGRR
jgi:Mor family transcriptional regulator